MKNSERFLTAEEIEDRVVCLMYIRDENKAPIGLVVLTSSGLFGWSLFNEKMEPMGLWIGERVW